MAGQSSSQAASPFQWWKPALFFLVVIVGLWFVKWQPYYGKAFTAAETHSIGKSILANSNANPFAAAWDFVAFSRPDKRERHRAFCPHPIKNDVSKHFPKA